MKLPALKTKNKKKITKLIGMQNRRHMSICAALEEIIKLAETATDADYHEKLEAIIVKAKQLKLTDNN